MQPFQPPPPGPSLAGWMANAAASSSVQSAVVAASSIPVAPNQGTEVWCYFSLKTRIYFLDFLSFVQFNGYITPKFVVCGLIYIVFCIGIQYTPETIEHVKLQLQAYSRCC
jgi:uncharacterized membrane protein (DUF4010 family)